MASASKDALTEREKTVLKALAEGDSNATIASRFGITEGTVKIHVKSIFRSIGAENRTQAALWAIANGLASARSPVGDDGARTSEAENEIAQMIREAAAENLKAERERRSAEEAEQAKLREAQWKAIERELAAWSEEVSPEAILHKTRNGSNRIMSVLPSTAATRCAIYAKAWLPAQEGMPPVLDLLTNSRNPLRKALMKLERLGFHAGVRLREGMVVAVVDVSPEGDGL